MTLTPEDAPNPDRPAHHNPATLSFIGGQRDEHLFSWKGQEESGQ